MSSLTNMFKGSRSKSNKLTTPPKIVFGDLNSAYQSIAQKTSPHTPGGGPKFHGNPSGSAEVISTPTPEQSPQSEASPSETLLRSPPSDTIRISLLSGDLFLPRDLNSPKSLNSPLPWDPFDPSHQRRTSFTTLEVTKNMLDGYFGVSSSDHVRARQEQDQSGPETKVLAASDYPELEQAQSKACSVLSGTEEPHQDNSSDVGRSGIVQNVPKRHPYGRVNTNENIKSIHGLHEVDKSDLLSEHAQQDEVRRVEWTPRSSIEAGAASHLCAPGQPPSVSLPQTPQRQEPVRYRHGDLTSPSKEGSNSSASYGNTQRLLQLSLPQLPEAPVPRIDLYHQLLHFAREGQSSSSQGNSSTSFAEFCIQEAHGARITRPISQGEFQDLQRTISEHRRRQSHMSDEVRSASLVRVGQISFRFPDTSSEVDLGPGSSQTASSTSEVEVNWTTGSVRIPERTRNGTPPLLFGSLNGARNDNDWETVGESNGMTSSIADVSDSVSGSPPRTFPSLPPGQVLKHPAHPRYNHSWDLQQDTRSGAFVLTPRYQQLPVGSSFPNQNALEPLSLRAGPNSYSHPTPLTVSHDNPFVTPPVQIAPDRQLTAANTQHELLSEGTSAWLSTVEDSDAGTRNTFAGADSMLTTLPRPPVPSKNPSRRWKQRISKESHPNRRSFNFGFHSSKSKLDQMSAMEEGNAADSAASSVAALSAGRAPTTALDGSNRSVRLRSPDRHPKAKAKAFRQRPEAQSDDEDNLRNPFNDPIDHERTVRDSGSPVANPFASTIIVPEDAFSPRHRGRAEADGTLDFITAEQARYMRSRSPDWAPNNMEMQAIISPLARTRLLAVPSPVSPRPWKPTPHPLAHHLRPPREESPHLCHLRNKPPATPRRMSHQQLVSRYYLVLCALVPILLAPYFLGSLDWVMRVHTGGVHHEMASHEKKLAVVIFCVELLSGVAFVPLIFSLV